MGKGMLEVAKAAPQGHALAAIIEHYLSAGARRIRQEQVGFSRVLGPELARKPLSVRKGIEASLEALP
jgi:TetR/AcrR family transcriptional regulator, transcriptional repressor for nem operon